MKTATEILNDTKSTLTEFGWIKGSNGSQSQGFCLGGAFAYSNGLPAHTDVGACPACGADTSQVTLASNALDAAIQLTVGDTIGIVAWNDGRAETKEEVLALIDRAVALVEAV